MAVRGEDMKCPKCGSWIDLISFGYGFVGVCVCGYLANEDHKTDMERFDARKNFLGQPVPINAA